MPHPEALPPPATPGFRSLGGLNRSLLSQHRPAGHLGRVVLGEGPVHASIAFVGEQPGDQEDREGKPFVGPAGRLLDELLAEADIDRSTCYVTNAVKQFSFTRRGKRRLHKRPSTTEIVHYRWWLGFELDYVDPGVIVALGATALFALAGRRISVNAHRGPYEFLGRQGFIAPHPSAILRIPDRTARHAARRAFLSDLRKVRRLSEAAGRAAVAAD